MEMRYGMNLKGGNGFFLTDSKIQLRVKKVTGYELRVWVVCYFLLR